MARTTFSGPVASTNGFIPTSAVAIDVTPAAAITAAQLATGKITSTSAAAVAITLPAAATAGTVQGLVPAVNAVAGQEFIFIVDNTAGANTVTLTLGAGGAVSGLGAAVGATFGLLTITAAQDVAKCSLIFTGGDGITPGSATGYRYTRLA